MTHRIKYWREKRGLSQADLAARLGPGYYQSTIAGVERGSRLLKAGEMKLFAEKLEVTELDLLPLTVLAEIEDDVELASPGSDEPAIEAAFAAKGLMTFRVIRDSLAAAGVPCGSLAVGDTTPDALKSVRDGDAIVVDAACPSEKSQGRLLRQYLTGGLLTTNRMSRNVSFNMNDPDYEVRVVAVLMKNPVGH